MRKTFAVGRKEFHQIVRDRRSLGILLLFPAFFLLLFGYALNWDVRHIALAVDDRDRSPESRALISAFVNSGYFDLVADRRQRRGADAADGSQRRRAPCSSFPPGFEPELQAGRAVSGADSAQRRQRQHRHDGDGLRADHRAERVGAAIGWTRRRAAPPVVVEPRIWYNPQLRSTLFLVPGLIAYIAMITAVVSTALSIVREKERGTMEQVRMAPLGALSFVARQDDPVLRASRWSSALGDRLRRDGAVRPADARVLAAAARRDVAVPGRRARPGPADFERRRDAAGRVSARAAGVVPADADAVGVHLPDREHAGRSSRRSPTSCRRATS